MKRTSAKLVLHSGWRMWFDDELKPLRKEAQKLVELLAEEGLFFDGVTPDLTTEEIRRTKKFSLVKADEILAYLDVHKETSAWVVLDDLALYNEQVEKHQVKPDAMIGLTQEDIEKAEIQLGGISRQQI